ncbi:MAG TPA: hypothetical protein DDW67_05140 [Elusimicrobia bacterium]|jgi:protein arginine kinase activator|nr:hypothetical protein [Elusimicrobiota bacterium]
MLCRDCHKAQATVFLKAAINNKVTEMHLCAACALKRSERHAGEHEPAGLGPMGGFVKELLPSERRQLACGECGLKYAEFRESGRLGCPSCYRYFGTQLRELLARIHGSCSHAGRRYRDTLSGLSDRERAEKMAALRAALKVAVEREDFEAAARLRDEVRELENGR